MAPGKELRHSFGSRIWGNKKNWKYDIEALYQFGKFTSKKYLSMDSFLKYFLYIQ